MPATERPRRGSTELEQRRQWHAASAQKFDEETNQVLERIWAAGFFDGQGSINLNVPDELLSASPKVRLQARERGELGAAVLDRFKEAVGVGSIQGPYCPEGDTWMWQAGSEEDVQAVFTAIGRYLGPAKHVGFKHALVTAGWLREERNAATGERRGIGIRSGGQQTSAEVPVPNDDAGSGRPIFPKKGRLKRWKERGTARGTGAMAWLSGRLKRASDDPAG